MASNDRRSGSSSGIMYNQTHDKEDKTFNMRAEVVSAFDSSSDFNDFAQLTLAGSTRSATTQRQDRTHDRSVQRCGEVLKDQYDCSTAVKIPLEPLRAKMAPVEMVHVPVVLKQWKFSPDLPMPHEISADNLFRRNNNENWKKLLVGPSGVGKTTGIKMWLQKWCKGKEGPFLPFRAVFYIDGNMLPADTRLGVAISEQCLPVNWMTPKEVEDMCRHNGRDVLIILDHYNRARGRDARTDDVDNLILLRDFKECNILVVTTCEHVTAMESILSRYEMIRAMGVRVEGVADYVMNVFKGRPPFGEAVMRYLHDNNLTQDMASSPVLLAKFCQDVKWFEKPSDLIGTLGNLKTKSALVKKMMKCIIQHKDTTSGVVFAPQPSATFSEQNSMTASQSQTLSKDQLLSQGTQELSEDDIIKLLGKVAFGRVFSCENNENWRLSREDFEILGEHRDTVIKGGVRSGLLSFDGAEQAYPTNQQAADGKVITFHVPHFGELLAADHLNRLLAGGGEEIASYNDSLQTVSSLDATLSRKQLMVYAGGHSPEAAKRIIGHVAEARAQHVNDMPSHSYQGETVSCLQLEDLRRKADELILDINYELQSRGQVNDNLQEVFTSPIILVSPTRGTVRALFYMLQHAAAEGRPLLTGVQVDVLNGPEDLMDEFSTLPVSRTDHGDVEICISQLSVNQGEGVVRIDGKQTMKQVTFKTQPRNPANQENRVQPPQAHRDYASRSGSAPVTTVAANAAMKETAPPKSRASQALPTDGQSADVTGQQTGDVLPTPVSASDNSGLLAVGSMHSQHVIQEISHKSYKIDDEQFIASGRYGEVYRTTWNGMDVAVKRVKLLEQSAKGTIQREISMNGRLNHPNIVKMHAYAIIQRGKTSKFGIDLVMDFIIGYTLDDAIFQENVPHLNTLKGQLDIAKALSDAVGYMHANNCTHSDIKPTNILISEDNQPFLCDLGLGHIFSQSTLSQSTPGTRQPCVQKYLPPEASESGVKVSAQWDVWSLACCLLELFTRKRIWENVTSDLQLVRRLEDPDVTPEILADVQDPTLREKFRVCFSKDSSERLLAWELRDTFTLLEDMHVSQASSPLTD